VHLSEIHMSQGQPEEAEALLLPALSSPDPEVRWRYGDVLMAQDRVEEAETQLEAARAGFEELLGGTCSPSPTMPRSSTRAAAATARGHSNLRARTSPIVRRAVPKQGACDRVERR
jgi:hypothetical protein